MLRVEPAELVFRDVCIHRPYSQTVVITNDLPSAVEVSIRAGSPSRYEVLCLPRLGWCGCVVRSLHRLSQQGIGRVRYSASGSGAPSLTPPSRRVGVG